MCQHNCLLNVCAIALRRDGDSRQWLECFQQQIIFCVFCVAIAIAIGWYCSWWKMEWFYIVLSLWVHLTLLITHVYVNSQRIYSQYHWCCAHVHIRTNMPANQPESIFIHTFETDWVLNTFCLAQLSIQSVLPTCERMYAVVSVFSPFMNGIVWYFIGQRTPDTMTNLVSLFY